MDPDKNMNRLRCPSTRRIISPYYLFIALYISCVSPIEIEDVPVAPVSNDSAYQISGMKSWYVKAKGLSPSLDSIHLNV